MNCVLLCATVLIAPLRAADLQRAMDRAMTGHAGTAVALDVDSGRILARYHPQAAVRRLARPGSTVKPFTMLALLAASPSPRTLICARKLRIGARQMDCTHPPTADPLDAVAALAYSCNYYFATLAAGLRNSDLVETFTRAGLISRAGLDAGEAIGEILPPATLEQRQLLALGEGNILVTPMGLACAYRKLALQRNRAIAEGLEAATEYGTARLARPPGMKVGGKTGTASDPVTGQIHAWFAGYAPVESPRIAVVVFLEQGVGGRDAAPIARELFLAALPAP